MRNNIFFFETNRMDFLHRCFFPLPSTGKTRHKSRKCRLPKYKSGRSWSPRIETNRTVSIPLGFPGMREERTFRQLRHRRRTERGRATGRLSFDDTDPYKIIEGASYSLAVKYDARLDAYLDSVIALIAAAQESDGYLTTA